MKALVTRPENDAVPVAAALRLRGIEPMIAPLLRVEPEPGGAARLAGALTGVQAVLFTSANGVRAFAAASHRFELPAFCVGEASAAAARIAGFRTVFSGDGDVGELAALVAARLSPHHGALLHVAGAATAGDLSGQLGHADFTARRAVLYRAVPVDALASELVAALHQGEIDLALFFSPRTAESFVRLALGVGVGERCESMTALALSRNVASPLGTLPWRAIAIADAPTLSALMTALDETLAGSRSA